MAQDFGGGIDIPELAGLNLGPSAAPAFDLGLPGFEFGTVAPDVQFPGAGIGTTGLSEFDLIQDTTTGQVMTFDQARQIDPQAFQEFLAANPDAATRVAQLEQGDQPLARPQPDILRQLSLGQTGVSGQPDVSLTQTAPATPGAVGSAGPAMTPEQIRAEILQQGQRLAGAAPGTQSLDPRQLGGLLGQGGAASDTAQEGGLTDLARILGFGGAALGLGTGVLGLIQRMVQGDRASATRVRQIFAAASPEQKRAIEQALRGFETAQATVPGLIDTLSQRAPLEQGAFAQGLGGLEGLTSGLLAGRLPIGPNLERTVEEAFSPQLGDLARRTIEQARRQGFAGGAELLQQAPAAALAGPSLAALQGQQAQAKLDLGQNLARLGLGGLSGLLGLGQQGLQNRLSFLQSGILPGQAFGNIGTQLQATQGQTTTTTKPFSLLDAFGPLSQLLAATGGVLGGASEASASGAPRAGTRLG